MVLQIAFVTIHTTEVDRNENADIFVMDASQPCCSKTINYMARC